MHVKRNNGWLAIRGVPFGGEMVTESLGIKDTADNRKLAAKKLRLIRDQLTVGAFHFETHFPHSKRLGKKENPVKAPTLREYAPDWLSIRALQSNLTPETQIDYTNCIAHILADEIADKLMSDITEDDLTRFVGRLEQKEARGGGKLSPRRVNMVIARLRTIFGDARRKNLVDGRKMLAEDPMQFIKNRRQAKTQVDPFDEAESLAIIDVAEGWFKNYLTVALFTGLRPNEILGLQWDDIDWKKRLILVRRTMSPSGMRPPKTVGSERDVEMVEIVRNALAEQRTKTGLSKSSLVFSTEDDTPINLNNLREREWKRLTIKAHVRHRPIYQCRHSFATMCLTRGDNVRHVAQQLGHSTIAMVVQVYSRWLRAEPSAAPVSGAQRIA